MQKKENINTWLQQINDSAKAAVSVDCVIFGYDNTELKVLTIECNMPPYEGKKSLVGDLVQSDENLAQAASRVLKDRVGLEDLYLEQVNTFGQPNRHPLGRVISTAYVTIVSISDHTLNKVLDRNPIWMPLKSITEMAFDHKLILKKCLKKLRRRIHSYPIVFSVLPPKFTIIALQTIYESILDKKLDKRNFRRKVKKIPYIIDLEELQSEVNHRPAKLYCFDFEMYKEDKAMDSVSFRL